MKILHCCLSNFYIDNYNYQENLLARQNKLDGHEVMIVASTEAYDNNMQLGYVKPAKYYTQDGIYIERIPYKYFPNKFIQHKLRFYNGFESVTTTFKPDIIMFHGVNAGELLTLKRIKKRLPHTKIYVDNHAFFANSAKNIFSKYFLHKLYYSNILHYVLPYIDKIFYVTFECKNFLTDFYGICEDKLEYLPLGGIIPDKNVGCVRRQTVREQYHLKESDMLLIHSGKMEKAKKTCELVQAFHSTQADNLKLLIIGTMTNDVAANVMPIVDADTRIEYLGWKSGEELMDYLCAADLYVQPGTQSATMQNALCCGSAAALFPYESHKFLLSDSVFYIQTIEEMKELLFAISTNPDILEAKRAMSNKIAHERLDYKVLAARLYQ